MTNIPAHYYLHGLSQNSNQSQVSFCEISSYTNDHFWYKVSCYDLIHLPIGGFLCCLVEVLLELTILSENLHSVKPSTSGGIVILAWESWSIVHCLSAMLFPCSTDTAKFPGIILHICIANEKNLYNPSYSYKKKWSLCWLIAPLLMNSLAN